MSIFYIIIPIQLVLFVALAMAPYVTRKSENFGVKTPEEQFSSPEMCALRRRYVWQCGLSAIAFTIPAVAAFLLGMDEFWSSMLYVGCVLALIAVMFLFFLRARRTVLRRKAEENWTYERPQVVSGSTVPLGKMASSLWVLIPSLLAVAAALWIGYERYPSMPDTVATHWDLQGNPDGFSGKSLWLIWMMPAFQLFMTLLFTGIVVMFRVTRRQLDSADPKESLRRSHLFRQSWTVFLIALGNLLILSFTFIQAAIFELADAMAVTYATLGVAGAAVIAAIALSLAVGQGGSRLRPPAKSVAIDRDDDRHWKLGSFYYNPDDPSVFVEKRFGVGMTCNFARPLTWVLTGLLVLVIAAVIALPFILS